MSEHDAAMEFAELLPKSNKFGGPKQRVESWADIRRKFSYMYTGDSGESRNGWLELATLAHRAKVLNLPCPTIDSEGRENWDRAMNALIEADEAKKGVAPEGIWTTFDEIRPLLDGLGIEVDLPT